MNLDLRQAIVQRMKNKSDEQIFEVIEGSIDGDERALPGLGVLFEIIWTNSKEATQQELVATLQKHL